MCFQEQNEIASHDYLFHRQGDQWIPQAIKDTLPYFLGAVDEEHFLRRAELDIAEGEVRRIENEIQQKSRIIESGQSRIQRLIVDGKRLGLVDQQYQPVDSGGTVEKLKEIAQIDITSPDYIPDFGETIETLRGEQKTLQDVMALTHQDIRAARAFLSDQTAYTSEGSEQVSRLKSINLFSATDTDAGICPVCQSELETPIPSVDQISSSLENLNEQMSHVHQESPHLQAHIVELEEQYKRQINEIRSVQASLNRTIAEDQRAREQQNQIISRAKYVGRVADFIESIEPEQGDNDSEELLTIAKERVTSLRAIVNSDDVAQRTDTCLNLVSRKMSEYSNSLNLEHSGSSLRLDLKKLTVVADTENGPIPLTRMGSGENWVGYHVLTHLALHWWFRRRNRPVPGFLMFDQPSQAHFPADRDQDGSLDPLNDDDRHAVRSLFKLMSDACGEIDPDFQLIVLDHAHLADDWFEGAIIEEWRNGKALIPADW